MYGAVVAGILLGVVDEAELEGSMLSFSASSSMAISRTAVPGASPGARMKVADAQVDLNQLLGDAVVVAWRRASW